MKGATWKVFFGLIVLQCAEYHAECDFSRTPCLPTGNDSSEGCATSLNVVPVYFHFLKGFLINEVQSATAVHEYLGKTKAVHYSAEDQCGWCSSCSEFRFITGVKGDGCVTPWVYCCHLVDFGKAVECPFLFDAKVSKTVNTVWVSLGWLSVASGIRRFSPILATCRSIQHALRL